MTVDVTGYSLTLSIHSEQHEAMFDESILTPGENTKRKYIGANNKSMLVIMFRQIRFVLFDSTYPLIQLGLCSGE